MLSSSKLTRAVTLSPSRQRLANGGVDVHLHSEPARIDLPAPLAEREGQRTGKTAPKLRARGLGCQPGDDGVSDPYAGGDPDRGIPRRRGSRASGAGHRHECDEPAKDADCRHGTNHLPGTGR
jgi:hypothetical protein